MVVFDRLDRQARRILVLAQEEAAALGHKYFGTEHLLIGLSRTDGFTGDLLARLGCGPTRPEPVSWQSSAGAIHVIANPRRFWPSWGSTSASSAGAWRPRSVPRRRLRPRCEYGLVGGGGTGCSGPAATCS